MCGCWAAWLPRSRRRGQPRTFAPSADAVAETLAHYFGE